MLTTSLVKLSDIWPIKEVKASIKQSHKTIRHITGPVPHKLTKAYTFDYGNVNFAEYVSLVLLSTAQYNQWGLNRQLINQSIHFVSRGEHVTVVMTL